MARPSRPIENMPCPKTLGSPASLAFTSSWCMGLKSPDAPAYITRSVRVSSWLTTGASSPSFTSSKKSFSSAIGFILAHSYFDHLSSPSDQQVLLDETCQPLDFAYPAAPL